MADIFLKAGESFPLSSANNNVFGKTGGSETLLLSAGATADIDANVERVEFPGNIGDYTFLRTGTNIQVLQGTTVVVEFAGLEQTTELSFGDGTADLVLTATGAELGGAALPTGTAAAVVPVTIDATDTSSTAAAPAASLSVADVSVDENAGNATFTVTLSTAPGAGETVTVDYATSDGTATAGADYTAATGTLTFAAGITTQTITVPVTDDVAEEADETFTVTLSNVAGTIGGTAATINDATASGTIVDNDMAGSTFTLTDQIDTIPGTAGNDLVIGDNNTASAADTLDMGDGTDTVRLYGTATIPSLNSVEGVEFYNITNEDIDTSNSTSLQTVLIKNAALTTNTGNDVTLANKEQLTLENVDTDGEGNTEGINLSTNNSEETIILNDVAGATGAQAFSIDTEDSSTDVTTLNLMADTNGSAVSLIDGDNKLATLNLTGDASLKVENAGITSLKTINASTNTAGVSVTFDAAASVSITGSGQDDTFIMSDNFTTSDTIDGGNGTDILYVVEEGTINGDLDVSNVETIMVGSDDTAIGTTGGINADRTVDLDNIVGITAVQVAGSNTATHANFTHTLKDIATTATTVNFIGDGTDALQEFDGINMDWDSSSELPSVTVNISNDGLEGKDFVIHDLNLTNVNSVNIMATNIGTGANEELTFETALDVSDAESLIISSNSDVVFTGITGSDDLERIDASDADAGVDFGAVSMLADSAVIELGAGNDDIELTAIGTAAADTGSVEIDLGAGNDILTLNANTSDTDNSVTTGAGSDTVNWVADDNGAITDFTVDTGGDILGFADASHTDAGAVVLNLFADDDGLDFASEGFAVDTGDNANAATLTAAQATAALTITNGTDGDKALIAVSTDVDAAASVYIYEVEASAAAAVDTIQLIGVLEDVVLNDLNASNLADFV